MSPRNNPAQCRGRYRPEMPLRHRVSILLAAFFALGVACAGISFFGASARGPSAVPQTVPIRWGGPRRPVGFLLEQRSFPMGSSRWLRCTAV